MAKLSDGFVFQMKMKNAITINVEQRELILCKHCKYWIPGEIDNNDRFKPPACVLHGGGWFHNDYCSDAQKDE